MATSYKNPPKFGEDISYETWKNELEVWRLMTDVDVKKQALAVTLTLSGKAREKAIEIAAADLNKDDGMKTLIEKLDELFKKDEKDAAYEAYSNFENFKKKADVSMSDYVNEFEQKYQKAKKYEMTISDAVLAYKLLDNANLSNTERKLALTATGDGTLKSMKSALKRIFSDSQSKILDEKGTGITVKEESALYTGQKYKKKLYQRSKTSHWKETDGQSGIGSMSASGSSRGTNPMRSGKRTTCAICNSTFHWAKDCPHGVSNVNYSECDAEDEICNMTLFTKSNELSKNEVFMTECFGCAVLDTACSKTVCGTKWIDNYIDSLPADEKEKVKEMNSTKEFKFGDGVSKQSINCVNIPVRIAGVYCNIDTEVVEADIPLLLSKESLKRANTVLDLANDKASMFKRPVQLQFTSSGHYCINLRDDVQNRTPEDIMIFEENLTQKEKIKMLEKLHKQFGHANSDRLKKLIVSAGHNDRHMFELLDDLVRNCDVCQKFKRPQHKPAVGFPLASEFNETVAVDLHQLDKNLWYLHIIDEFSRFSAGAIMKNKYPETFVKLFIKMWIGIHGAPNKLFSDNGGEFNNKTVQDMCENFNIQLMTTAAYSPWSNGLLERHNYTLTEILNRIQKDNSCDWETALSWALMSKNCLANVHGYSSYQLVYGKNPNLPSIFTDRLPALEGTTTSTIIGEHIKALYSARKAFTEAECSERIRRALRKQTRPTTEFCQTGEKVYYKRPDGTEWKGPGAVIGQDGVIVFIRHGGIVVRVHRCRIKKLNESNKDENMKTENGDDRNKCKQADDDVVEEDEENLDTNIENNDVVVRQPEEDVVQLKPGQVIKYKDNTNNEEFQVKVLNRAGKATGIHRNWFNVEYQSPNEKIGTNQSVDFSQMTDIEILPNDNHEADEENVMILENVSFDESKLAELESWRNNKVYEEIEDNGQNCISTRWVCTLKETVTGIKPKSRLVVRGFEELENEQIQKDSPTCAKESLRVILSILAQNRWKPYAMDIKTAFLQGKALERDIFVKPPKEAQCHGKLWHLNKCVYGLGDASLYWYNTVRDIMVELGAKISKIDPAVFMWSNDEGQLKGLLACHVDDFIWGGRSDFEDTIIKQIRSKLCIGKEENTSFKYVGIDLTCNNGDILLNQSNYAKSIVPINILSSRLQQKESPLEEQEIHTLRSKVGQILWISRQSRPDLIFDASSLASRIKDARVKDLIDANKLIKRVKSENLTLKFQKLDGDLSLVVYSDSSLGNLQDGGTQGGYLILLKGEKGKFSPVAWNSKRIRRVVRSTLSGETLAMADAIDSGVFISTLYSELVTGCADPTKLPLVCVTDNKSLLEAVKSTKCVTEKRLRLEITGIKEMIRDNQVKEIKWSDTKRQLADCLTKRGASSLILMKTLDAGVLKL